MTLNIIRDAERLMNGPPEHAIAMCDALFDYMDPNLTPDEQADALERVAQINPTGALVMLAGLMVYVDKIVSEASGKQPGVLIAQLRERAPAIIRRAHPHAG